jgi:hypothetical protein
MTDRINGTPVVSAEVAAHWTDYHAKVRGELLPETEEYMREHQAFMVGYNCAVKQIAAISMMPRSERHNLLKILNTNLNRELEKLKEEDVRRNG